MASGSDKRQRNRRISLRYTDDEFNRIAAKADRAGLAVAAFLRASALDGDAGVRARRRPPADHKALRQLLGECARVGNNINQIARRLNADGPLDIPELREALAAYLEIRAAILRALAMDMIGEHSARVAPDDH
jgi:hypothetical protein